MRAGASHFPLVVFPAWFSDTGALLGVPGFPIGYFSVGAGLEGGAPVPGTPVSMPVLPGPRPYLLLAKPKFSNRCLFSIFTQSLGVF